MMAQPRPDRHEATVAILLFSGATPAGGGQIPAGEASNALYGDVTPASGSDLSQNVLHQT
jgi:hypothetical protein